MTPAPLRLLSLGVALAAVLAVGACNKPGGGSATAAAGGDPSEAGYTIGAATAPVKVVELGSLTCPHCAHWEEEVWPAFKAKYVDTGKVQYTFHEFIIHPAEDAAGAQLTHCVSPDKYFPTVQAIFRSQSEMATGDVRGAFLRVAQSEGMSEQQFTTCLSDEKYLTVINARQQKLQDTYQVLETPSFFINGKKFEGAPTIEKLSEAIDPLLKK